MPSVVSAVPLRLIELPRRTSRTDTAILAVGWHAPDHGRAIVAHVRHARALAEGAAETGTRVLLAGGLPGRFALWLTSVGRAVGPDAGASILATALGLPLTAGAGEVRRSDADPLAVGWLAAALGEETLLRIAARHPHLVGPVDGMPVTARDLANRLIASAAAERFEARGDHERAAALRALADGDHGLLYVDPARGHAAQLVGDLVTAEHVAVFVPGMGSSIEGFGTIAARARALRAAAADLTPSEDLAVVAWLGYDSPSGIAAAAREDAARAGADDLVRFVAGLPVAAGVTRTVVAHSYGSTVTGAALRSGLRADAVVVAGSPGMLADSEQALGGTPVYALRTGDDLASWSHWFGADPSEPDFGATRLDTGDAEGHSEYFEDGEALGNIALVATDRAADATVVEPDDGLIAKGVDALDELYDVLNRPIDTAQEMGEFVDDLSGLPGGLGELGNRTVDFLQRAVSPDGLSDLFAAFVN